ncbi:MAG: hypothetical protein F9K22_14635 [Bacteroidetes bacterium]|nr:MAG: hypothetical protein F9K22_14635 [Bacteroidota bacterium]
MEQNERAASLDEQIGQWREFVRRRRTIGAADAAELEDHLREQIAGLTASGLSSDEAFLVAVKRMGALDALSREFAREHSDRLWKQLVLTPAETDERSRLVPPDAVTAILFALGAALLVKVPAFFGITMEENEQFYVRNVAFFVLPLLALYFIRRRRFPAAAYPAAAAFIAGAVAANTFPFGPESHTGILLVLHLPIALWFVVGLAYTGGRWNDPDGRMDFIRFSGELFIYYVLIALGGGVFTMFLAMLFTMIGVRPDLFIQTWLIPCGAAGAVLIGSWLVEAKQGVIENMAPVLTRLFTPLFTLLLVVFLATLLVGGRGLDIDRDVLIAFDLLLVMVLALLLYSVSARDPYEPPGLFDVLQLVLVVSALMADMAALWAITARISEFGLTPNRVAALGLNILLLINLARSAALALRFVRGSAPIGDLERWQTSYLPVFALWAAVVVFVFPPLFGFR